MVLIKPTWLTSMTHKWSQSAAGARMSPNGNPWFMTVLRRFRSVLPAGRLLCDVGSEAGDGNKAPPSSIVFCGFNANGMHHRLKAVGDTRRDKLVNGGPGQTAQATSIVGKWHEI